MLTPEVWVHSQWHIFCITWSMPQHSGIKVVPADGLAPFWCLDNHTDTCLLVDMRSPDIMICICPLNGPCYSVQRHSSRLIQDKSFSYHIGFHIGFFHQLTLAVCFYTSNTMKLCGSILDSFHPSAVHLSVCLSCSMSCPLYRSLSISWIIFICGLNTHEQMMCCLPFSGQ